MPDYIVTNDGSIFLLLRLDFRSDYWLANDKVYKGERTRSFSIKLLVGFSTPLDL